MISLEDWALIRHLHHSEKLSQRAIAKQLSVARKTVAAALASDGPPKYERAPVESAISAVEPRIRALLSVYPQMPATVIAERVSWSGSMSWFRERVAEIRPEYAPADPADRLEHRPGRVVQCDLWFPPAKIPLGFEQVGCPPVLVMVAAFSRFLAAVMLPSRQTMDLVAGMWLLLAGQLGAVPRELWWDNEAGIGRRGRLTDPVTGFVGTLATKLVQLKPDNRSPRASSSGPTGIWRPRSYPGAVSTRPLTSMSNWPNGFRSPIDARCAASTGARSTSSVLTPRRCWHCLRWHRTSR